ncbi:MAG: hypothetical protein OHK0039_35880 [Bacteroidia bacterium]
MSSAAGRRQIEAHLALWAVAVIYSLNFFLAKEVFAGIAPLAMVALRGLGSSLLFGLLAALRGVWRLPPRAIWGRLVLCSLFGASINQICFFTGLSRTLEVNAAVLMTTSPVFVLLLAAAQRQERLRWYHILGLVVALGGALGLSLSGRRPEFGLDTLPGDVLVVLNALLYATYLVLVRPLMHQYHPFFLMFWIFTIGLVVNIPVALPSLAAVPWADLSAGIWLRAGYIVVFVTVAAYTLNAWALQRVSATAVGTYIYLQPVMVTALSLFWLQRPLSPTQVLFILLVLGGVYTSTYRGRVQARRV